MRVLVHVLAGGLLFAWLAAPVAAREIWEGKPPHGRDLMSPSERRLFWREFLALETDDERRSYWLAHNEAMDRRAEEWGVSLEPARTGTGGDGHIGFWRPPYFTDIMTEEEQAKYRTDLDALPVRESRQQYVREHILRMQLRAAERGISIPSARAFDDVFEVTTADEAAAAVLGYDPRSFPPPVAANATGDDADSLDASDAESEREDDSLAANAAEAQLARDADSLTAGADEAVEESIAEGAAAP